MQICFLFSFLPGVWERRRAIMGTRVDVVEVQIMNQPTDKSGTGEYVKGLQTRDTDVELFSSMDWYM